MKKTILTMAGSALSLLFVAANAQTVDSTQVPPPTTTTTTTTTVSTWDYKKNPTVDSINAKYKDKMIAARPAMTTEQVFPVLGQYTSTTNTDAPNVSISLDTDNKGLVWIEGLPQGKVKAYLRQSPAVYKIPAQKLEDGKEVKEGTLVFDKDANTLNIVIGKPYNAADPLAVFAPATEMPAEETVVKTKTKTAKGKVKTKAVVKPWTYSGTKVETTTAVIAQ
jgi:hypothetical protein